MSHNIGTQDSSAVCEVGPVGRLEERDAYQRVVVELRDRRREQPLSVGSAVLTFAIDAVIFVCITHLAKCGVLPGLLAGGLIGSLVGARIYAARTRALGFSAGAVGALVMGLASVFSLRDLRA